MKDKPNDLTILMATYEGEKFLQSQLASFAEQDTQHIQINVSDDSRSDRTRDALSEQIKDFRNYDLHYSEGPRKGFVENFRALILNCTPQTRYFAFSDQDDIWLPDKTSRSLTWLQEQPSDVPALYCGRTQMIDQDGRDMRRLSPLFSRAPAFKNALVQSIAGGNTMTMNRAAFVLLKRSLVKGTPISHDWWAYIMVTGAGGAIKYDPQPLTLYRQHGDNIVGENSSYAARAARLQMVMDGTWRRWQDVHLKLLADNWEELTPDAQSVTNSFMEARRISPIGRLNWLRQSGVWRQTKFGTASLYIATLAGRL
ncbi:glycosyltransferase [Hoeflea sp. IMCC20628]|uniref:glycosyltransferase n=1 Tax=Hoeflea sp. IMCC20628 TaxID=1620421 RepID=UPI00063AC30C|nr:glycosyltransferase [Hoeflea sp. IMCC20628]